MTVREIAGRLSSWAQFSLHQSVVCEFQSPYTGVWKETTRYSERRFSSKEEPIILILEEASQLYIGDFAIRIGKAVDYESDKIRFIRELHPKIPGSAFNASEGSSSVNLERSFPNLLRSAGPESCPSANVAVDIEAETIKSIP